jgi:hypothetical protein
MNINNIFLILFYYYLIILYVYGRFPPAYRWNVDQVPLSFAQKPRRVIDFKNSSQIWVSTPSPGLQKRQCSLIICIGANGIIIICFFFEKVLIFSLGTLMKVGIIFQGTGKRVKEELSKYDPRVVVFWQKHAWADQVVCESWANTIFFSSIGRILNFSFIIFINNINIQNYNMRIY